LRHRNKTDRALVEAVHQPREIQKRPAQAIHLIYNDAIDVVGVDIFEQLLESRAVEISAGKAAVIIMSGDQGPAQMLLAFDIRFAGLTLGVQ